MHIAGIVLSLLFVVGILVVGVRFVLIPESAATGYGVPASGRGDAAAYLANKGVRDGVSGLIVLALLAAGQLTGAGWLLLVAALIPIGDAVIVLRHGGSKVIAYAVHAATAVVMVGAGLMLLLG
jgi:Na+/proline symporter